MDRNQLLNDPETAMIMALDGRQSQIWTAMPAVVESVDLVSMTVEVQPAIQGVVTNPDGTTTNVNLPLLVDVPICFPSAGGFSLTLPVAAGDEVLVIIASRCIDGWWQNGGVQPQVEFRMHDLSDGFAIPGPRSQVNLVSAISATSAQLRSDDGSVFLEITPGGQINLKAPSGVHVTGNFSVAGDVSVNGSVTTTGEVTGNSIPLSTHKHIGVTTGSGTSGVPTP